MVKISIPKVPSFKAPSFKAPSFKAPSFKAPSFKAPKADVPSKAPDANVPTKAPDADVPTKAPDGGLNVNLNLKIETPTQASKGMSQSMLRRCGKNPAKCAAAATVGGLAIYTAVKYPENSKKQNTCITECMPPGWDVGTPEYHATDDDPENPRCTFDKKDDCDAFCNSKCRKIHPTTMVDNASDFYEDTADNIIGPVMDFAGVPLDGIAGNAMQGLRLMFTAVPAIIGLIIVWKVWGWMTPSQPQFVRMRGTADACSTTTIRTPTTIAPRSMPTSIPLNFRGTRRALYETL